MGFHHWRLGRHHHREMDMNTLAEEATRRFCADVMNEVIRAKAKFPENTYNLAALNEECGEVANAMLAHVGCSGADNIPFTWDGVYKECVQVAAMAMRI